MRGKIPNVYVGNFPNPYVGLVFFEENAFPTLTLGTFPTLTLGTFPTLTLGRKSFKQRTKLNKEKLLKEKNERTHIQRKTKNNKINKDIAWASAEAKKKQKRKTKE